MKTNLTKRLLSLLLGAVMLISLFSTAVTAWAESTYVKDIVLTVDEDLQSSSVTSWKSKSALFKARIRSLLFQLFNEVNDQQYCGYWYQYFMG